MNSFILAYVGGIVGAVLMDITETLAARAGLTSGVSVALVGRWALGLLRGQWVHADIARSPERPGEVRMGWAFHFLVGGGGVACSMPCCSRPPDGRCPRIGCGAEWPSERRPRCFPGCCCCRPSAGVSSGGAGREGPTPCWPARSRTFPMGWASAS